MSGTRTLWLMRHAKAADFVPGGRDFDRPLTDRGRRQAVAVGAWFGDRPHRPTYALCSPSVRTRQTLAGLGLDLAEHLAPGIWDGGVEDILAEIATVDEAVLDLLVVGHGPGIPALAEQLAEGDPSAPPALLDDLRGHFPTAAVAELRLDSSWTDVAPGEAHLVAFRSSP